MTLQNANEYVAQNAARANEQFRPLYHASAPVGWINDPNGFIHYQGQYHLYCQHHPYNTVWGPMHWGHWTSNDLLRWQWHGDVLAPDAPFDALGCFSGTALEQKGKLYLMYTGVSRAADGEGAAQQQCIAESDGGFALRKWPENPVIRSRDLPEGASSVDFRDPKLFAVPGGYRAVMASRGEKGGQLLAYDSSDLRRWTFAGKPVEGVGEMLECPDCFSLGGHEVYIACVMGLKADGLRFPASQTAVWLAEGRMETLDFGLDFYAPQTALAPDGRRILIAWMHSWDHEAPTHRLGHLWANTMTLPRELSWENGKLLSRPAREVRSLRRDARAFAGEFHAACPNACELEVEFAPRPGGRLEIRLLDGFLIEYDAASEILRVDRSACAYSMGPGGAKEKQPWAAANVPLRDGKLILDVFVDACSVEVFVNNGEAVLSSAAYPGEARVASVQSANGACRGTLWALAFA